MMNKQRIYKLTLASMSVSALLALSACSGDKATDEPAASASADTSVEMAEPVIEAEPNDTVIAEPVPEVEVTVEPEIEVTAEPEMLAADAGAKLYETNCKVCHAAGLLDAPKYGDKAAWEPRLAKGKETLHMHSAQGFNKMPAQATDKVSEAQVYAAVDYMVAAVS